MLNSLSGRFLILTTVFVMIAEILIFVPSVAGISHAPEEHTAAADVTNGANVLLHTLLAIDAAGV